MDPKPASNDSKPSNPATSSKCTSGAIHTINLASDDAASNSSMLHHGGATTNAGNPTPSKPRVGFPPLLVANLPKGEDTQNFGDPTSRHWRCRFCEDASFHAIQECNAFKTENPTSRWSMIKATGVCTKCFQRGHLGKEYPSNVLRAVCGGRHNTLMHNDQPLGPNPPSE